MALIDEYIQQIRNAIYGKDVRAAIANGIQQCYTDVSDSVNRANTAAANADTKANLANSKAAAADAAASTAYQNASSANTAAINANSAAEKLNGMTAAAALLPSGSSPTAQVSEVSGHKHISFGIPKGDTGAKGKDFHIAKTFTSIAEMNAYTGSISLYDCAMIDTGSVEDADTGKLFCYEEDEKWHYIGDLSGAQGIKGETGNGIASVVLNPDFTLTFNWTDGGQYTTGSIRGEQGIQGPTGETGATGPTGPTPALSIGIVTDLPAGNDPTVTLSGTAENPVMNFGIPHGLSGNETIDDTAGEGDVDLVWSADKLTVEKKTFDAKKSPAIYEEIESVPLATFADGAEDMPLKDMKVAIEPVQDLHGYDHPWPAGGGKNVADTRNLSGTVAGVTYSSDENGIISLNGTRDSSTGWKVIKTFSGIEPGNYVFSTNNNHVTCLLNYTQKPGTFTVAEGDSVKIALNAAIGESVSDTGIKVQIESGSTATEWTPFENICPISGWTGAKVTRTGKNVLKLFDTDSTHRGVPITKENGVVKRVGTWDSTNLSSGFSITGTTISSHNYSNYINTTGNNTIKLKPGTYTASAKATKVTGISGVNLFFATFSFLGGTIANGVGLIAEEHGDIVSQKKTWTFTLTEEAYFYCGITSQVPSNGTAVDLEIEAQLEVGDSDTAFVPYSGDTYDITFPSEAGTVYGGILDVTTGELVVDRAMVDMGSLTWSAGTWGAYPYFYAKDLRIPGIWKGGISNISNLECSMYQKYTRTYLYSNNVTGICFGNNGANPDVIVRDARFSTAEEFVEAVTGQQLVYELETPITYQLTPQEVRTLLGQNNIWADAGDVSLLYPADTKAYIDAQIASTRKLIAGIETGFTASKAYSVGDMLIIGNDLYKVSASIASGATITVGTNVTKTTVAEQLIALANA